MDRVKPKFSEPEYKLGLHTEQHILLDRIMWQVYGQVYKRRLPLNERMYCTYSFWTPISLNRLKGFLRSMVIYSNVSKLKLRILCIKADACIWLQKLGNRAAPLLLLDLNNTHCSRRYFLITTRIEGTGFSNIQAIHHVVIADHQHSLWFKLFRIIYLLYLITSFADSFIRHISFSFELHILVSFSFLFSFYYIILL